MAGYGDPTSAIQALYKQAGIQDAGRGSGFADLNYWADAANRSGGWSDYWQNRLGSDLAGTGTDQPTGTPGQGPWQQSGRGGSMPRTTAPAPAQPPPMGTSGWWNPPGYTPTMVPGGGSGGANAMPGQNPYQQWQQVLPRILQALAQINPNSYNQPGGPIGENPNVNPFSPTGQGAGGTNPNLEAIIQRALMGANY